MGEFLDCLDLLNRVCYVSGAAIATVSTVTTCSSTIFARPSTAAERIIDLALGVVGADYPGRSNISWLTGSVADRRRPLDVLFSA